MRLLQRAIAILWLTTGLLPVGTAAQTPTISLKAVGRQVCERQFPPRPCIDDSECEGRCAVEPIEPTNEILAVPGDIIVTEIYTSEWSPNMECLHTYQFAIGLHGFRSGGRGTVLPLGWNRPFEPFWCASDNECPDEWPVCFKDYYCAGPDHNPYLGAFIDVSHHDFVFFYASSTALESARYIFGATGVSPIPECWYYPPSDYLGTLVLNVSDDACGTFAVTFDPEPTHLRDSSSRDIGPLVLEPLTISTPLCVVGSDPPNCAIDARQPSEPDGSDPAGWDAATLEFSSMPLDIEPADFSLTVQPAVADPPEIILVGIEPPAVTLYLDTTVPPGHWTCFTYLPSAEALCLGSLPGDVNADLHSTPMDITALIEALTAHVRNPLPISQSDVDRSGRSAPPDILRIVDLLNGAEAYDAWLQMELPPCPSSR